MIVTGGASERQPDRFRKCCRLWVSSPGSYFLEPCPLKRGTLQRARWEFSAFEIGSSVSRSTAEGSDEQNDAIRCSGTD